MREENNTASSFVLRYVSENGDLRYKLDGWSCNNIDCVLTINMIDEIPRSIKFNDFGKSRCLWSDSPKATSRFFFSTISVISPNVHRCNQFPLLKHQDEFDEVLVFRNRRNLWIKFNRTKQLAALKAA
jgi:hypothetical protein